MYRKLLQYNMANFTVKNDIRPLSCLIVCFDKSSRKPGNLEVLACSDFCAIFHPKSFFDNFINGTTVIKLQYSPAVA